MPGMRGNFIQLSAFFWFLRSDLEKQIEFIFTHLAHTAPILLALSFTLRYPEVAHYSRDV